MRSNWAAGKHSGQETSIAPRGPRGPRWSTVCLAFYTLLCCLASAALAGAEGTASPDSAAAAASDRGAESAAPSESTEAKADHEGWPFKFFINGFLNEAWARSDGNEIYGIGKGGTFDYRTAAVILRVEPTPDDIFSVKLRHERIGASEFQQFIPEVGLDWFFYEHRFGDDTAIRVGRVKIPFGIYNEVRDVGTLLPFYRPPTDFYGTGSFTTETVDGALVSHQFHLGSWQLDGDLYGGGWQFVQRVTEGVFQSKVRDSIGTELWLTPPVPGLRVGAGGMIFHILDPGGHDTTTVRANMYHVSLEEDFGRVLTQVEYKRRDIQDAHVNEGYAHAGVRLTDKVTLNGQVELEHVVIMEVPQGFTQDRDWAVGLNYAFAHSVVLKGEVHWNRGQNPEAPAPVLGTTAKLSTRYGILSLATDF